MKARIIVALVLSNSIMFYLSADNDSGEEIRPPHVLLRVNVLRSELEELRYLMGRPKIQQPEIKVTDAAPREVYFQALTLFQKADRFCFEHTRERVTAPHEPASEIVPADVLHVVDEALARVRRVKKKYGLETRGQPGQLDNESLPSDVYRSIVQANRQLNYMLERRFEPSDVFQQVTRGVGYTSRLLQHFPEAITIPDEPPFEEGKRPADVYQRLLGCVARLRTIAELSNLKMLRLEVSEQEVQTADPSDVYDVASLVVAELAFLHSQLPNAKPPREVYYVGRKFPSHVFQRVGILERQLAELEQWVAKNPDWLVQ